MGAVIRFRIVVSEVAPAPRTLRAHSWKVAQRIEGMRARSRKPARRIDSRRETVLPDSDNRTFRQANSELRFEDI